MSENPYQTPESIPELVDPQELSGDFSLLRNTSIWAIFCVLLLGAEIILSVFGAVGIWPSIGEHIMLFAKVMFALWLLIIITFCVWTNKSMTNAWVAGEPTPTITSANSVIYYFIPILWFWKPYVAMKQMWDNLFGTESSKVLLRSWWFMWVGFWVLILIARITFNSEYDNFSF